MTIAADGRASWARGTAVSVALLASPTLVAYTIPLLGVIVSLLLTLLITARVRSRLWPRCSAPAARWCSVLAIVGLWLPALSSFTFAEPNTMLWLLIPLCAPEQMSAYLIPALAATAVSFVGAGASALARHPWPWVLAAWVAPLAYLAAGRWLTDGSFFC